MTRTRKQHRQTLLGILTSWMLFADIRKPVASLRYLGALCQQAGWTTPFVAVLAFTVLILAGCSSTTSGTSAAAAQLPIQYATLKLIEQSEVSAPDVVAHVERVHAAIASDPGVSLDALIKEAAQAALIAGLSPADQLLLNYLLGLIQVSLGDLNLLDEAQRLQAVTVLDWVRQAASMSAGA